MNRIYKFVKDVTREDCKTLPRPFKAGETVQRGSDSFGRCRDDALMGVETVPCTIDGKFVFTVPVDLLQTENGGAVLGDYRVKFGCRS